MSIFELYLLTLIPNLAFFFGGTGLLSSMALLICVITKDDIIGSNDCHQDAATTRQKAAKLKKINKYIFIYIIIALTLATAIPSRGDLVMILGGHYASNSIQLQKLPENTAKALNTFLETYTEQKEK